MNAQKNQWFIDNNNVIFQVHPEFEGGTNARFDADITPSLVRELKPIDDFGNLHNVENTYKIHATFAELIAENPAVISDFEACFIDCDGVVHLISSVSKNESTASFPIICESDSVIHCGEHLKGEGYAIEENYTLHHSISDFAKLMDSLH